MAQPVSGLRVLLVDDSPKFLESAAGLLAHEPGVTVVGCAASGQEALDLTARLRPDLVLMDMAMPDMTGLDAARRIKVEPASPRIVVMTLYDTPQYRAEAARLADGFLSKVEFASGLMPLIDKLFPDRHSRDPHHGG